MVVLENKTNSVRVLTELIENFRKTRIGQSLFVEAEADSENYQLLLTHSWFVYSKPNEDLEFFVKYEVPCEFLRFANEYFWLDEDDVKEIHIMWDSTAKKFYLHKQVLQYEKGELPIVRLYKEEPKIKPLGLYGICQKPRTPCDLYGVNLYINLAGKISPVSVYQIFN